MFTTLPPEPMTWVFVGDSITHGCLHTHGARNFVEHCIESVRWSAGRPTDVVINGGVSGWGVPDLLADLEFRLQRFDPDVVVLMLGTNDALAGTAGVADFSTGLEELTGGITGSGARLVLQVPPPVRGEPSGRTALPEYCDAIRDVARRVGVPVVDHERNWIEHFGDAAFDEWLDDDIHPNAAGHLAMARAVLAGLGVPRDSPTAA